VALLSADAIVAQAAAMAGIASPVVSPFRANLDLLLACLNAEAGLKASALAGVQEQLVLPLRNRLEVSDWIRRHPEIRDEKIEQPIFLTGLPRSGTTYFQYLFDPEPSMRMLRYWEGQRPCPPPGFAPETIAGRIAECAAEKAQARGNPLRARIAQIHLSDADGPEECLKVLDQTFANVGHYWTYRVPRYFARCLDGVDLLAAYEHYRQVLQLLQWRGEKKRWVLKWPCHLVALDAILQVFPDAKFVVTHRDPVQALASNCSLSAMLRRGTSHSVDLHEIGQQMKAMIHAYLQRLVAFDKQYGERIAHVDYRTAVDQPDLAVAQALDRLGIPMTGSFEQAIVAWRAENPPGKRGTHDYALADYGLDAGEVAAEYAFYTERFAVPAEAGEAA
jgi:Sulfotransferase family